MKEDRDLHDIAMNENYQTYLKENLEKYEDKWVVIIDKKIVASGDSLKELLGKVRKEHGTKTPFVAKVPKKTFMTLSASWSNALFPICSRKS